MVLEDGALDDAAEKLLKSRKLQFMVQDTFLVTTLQDLMDKLKQTSESTLEIWYSFALEKPRHAASFPQDEWLSTIASLEYFQNVAASDYICALFNGDLKVLSADNKEMLEVKSLHEGRIIDALYLKEDESKRYVVTVSEQPDATLKVSTVEIDGTEAMLKPFAKASDDLAER